MSHVPKRPRYSLDEDVQAQSEAQGLVDAQVPEVEEEVGSSSSSPPFGLSFLSPLSSSSSSCSSSPPISSSLTFNVVSPSSTSSSSHTSSTSLSPPSSSSSFHFSYLSTSSSSSSPVNPATQDEEAGSAAAASSSQQSIERSVSTLTSRSTLGDSSSSEEENSPGTVQPAVCMRFFNSSLLEKNVSALVQLLLLRFQTGRCITEAEMLDFVLKGSRDQFPAIFQRACKCMEMVFGIDVKVVDPTTHTFVLVNLLDLSSSGVPSDIHHMPKNGLLILVLGIIFLEGNCISEEVVWEILSMMGLYPGKEHCIYGDPRQLIARDWVQENYLEYRQIPDSDPARYEILWGPRAHAETNKMKVLEFLAKAHGSDLSAFSFWLEEAVKDMEEKAQARNAPPERATDECTAQPCPVAPPVPDKE